jgi:DNA-binding transcriptional ArsR family regulator
MSATSLPPEGIDEAYHRARKASPHICIALSLRSDIMLNTMATLPVHLLDHVADRFRVLGDATRLRIIHTLLDAGELNVGEIVERLGMSQANVSKHLRLLQEANILHRRPQGTAAYYSVADPTIPQLCDLVCDRLRLVKREEADAFATA